MAWTRRRRRSPAIRNRATSSSWLPTGGSTAPVGLDDQFATGATPAASTGSSSGYVAGHNLEGTTRNTWVADSATGEVKMSAIGSNDPRCAVCGSRFILDFRGTRCFCGALTHVPHVTVGRHRCYDEHQATHRDGPPAFVGYLNTREGQVRFPKGTRFPDDLPL